MQHDETEEPNIYPAKTRALREINCAVRTSPLPSISPESAELKHRYSTGTQREGPIATAQAEGQADLKPKRDTRLVCHSTPPLAHDNHGVHLSTREPGKGTGEWTQRQDPRTVPHRSAQSKEEIKAKGRERENKEKKKEHHRAKSESLKGPAASTPPMSSPESRDNMSVLFLF